MHIHNNYIHTYVCIVCMGLPIFFPFSEWGGGGVHMEAYLYFYCVEGIER